MSKWRFTPLLVVVAAALTAFASEGPLVSEIAKVVGLVALVLFLLLFATRHRSEYRTGGDERRTQRSTLGVAILALVLGCSSTPQRERMRASGATMEAQGQRLEREAEWLRSQAADRLIESAERMRADADALASEGVALREHGREAADLGTALLALVLGCSSAPQRPAAFLMPSNEFTWERGERMRASGATMEAQGQRLEKEAERLRGQAADLEKQGRSLIESAERMRADADVLASEGSALRERGREAADLGADAIEAARKLEESERLRREAEEQRERSRL